MIELHPFTRSDISLLLSWVPSEAFLALWAGPGGLTYPLDEAQVAAQFLPEAEDPRRTYSFKAVDPATGETVGHIQLLNVDRHSGWAVVGRVLIGPPELRCRGLGEAMVRAVVALAFDRLVLRHLRLHVYDFNEPAIACYQRVGFRIDEYVPERVVVGEERWGWFTMTLSAEEWRTASTLQRADPGAGT